MAYAHFSSQGHRHSMKIECTNFLESRPGKDGVQFFVSSLSDGPSWSRRITLLPIDGGLLDVEEQFLSPNPDLFISIRDDQVDQRTVYLNAETTRHFSEVAPKRTRVDFEDGTSIYLDIPYKTVEFALERGATAPMKASGSEVRFDQFLV